MSSESVQVRIAWDLFDLDDRMAERIAHDVTVDAATMALMNHVADRLPKGKGRHHVSTSYWLRDLPPDGPWLRKATAEDVQAWFAGTEPIPDWVARLLLHLVIERKFDDDEDDEEYGLLDEDEDEL